MNAAMKTIRGKDTGDDGNEYLRKLCGIATPRALQGTRAFLGAVLLVRRR
jgi:hypothetical protein